MRIGLRRASRLLPAPVITNANSSVILAGAGTDPGLDPITCSWTVDSAPFGSSAAAQSPAQCTTAFTPDLVGDYRMRLTVRDPMGNTSSCITEVRSNPFGGLWVEMFWRPAGDIDLHMLHSGGGSPLVYSSWLDQTWSCFYGNCQVAAPTTLAWDTPSPDDDPSLDVDSISGPVQRISGSCSPARAIPTGWVSRISATPISRYP